VIFVLLTIMSYGKRIIQILVFGFCNKRLCLVQIEIKEVIKNYSYSISKQLLIHTYPSYQTPRMVVMKIRKPANWEKLLAIVVGISLGILFSTSSKADLDKAIEYAESGETRKAEIKAEAAFEAKAKLPKLQPTVCEPNRGGYEAYILGIKNLP